MAQAVIFDLDGTLYAMTSRFKPLMTIMCFPHCLRVPKYMKIRDKYRGKDMLSGIELKQAISSDLNFETGLNNSEKWIEECFYPAFVSTLRFLRNRPQVNSLFSALKDNGIKIAVLSDFGRVEERLKALKIDLSLIDVIESTERVGAFKPCSRPFFEVCEKLGVKPEKVTLIGDRDDTDRAGAEASGLKFFKVDGKSNKNWLSSVEKMLNFINH